MRISAELQLFAVIKRTAEKKSYRSLDISLGASFESFGKVFDMLMFCDRVFHWEALIYVKTVLVNAFEINYFMGQ